MIIAIFFVTLLPCSANGEDNKIDRIVKEIQDRYDTITDMKGNFTQDSYVKDLEEQQSFSGKFFIKMPSRFKWEYMKPRNEIVIVNGSQLWIYKKAENQVVKARFSAEAYGQAPIALLAGMGDLTSDFTITQVEKNILQLIPKASMGIINRILMATNPSGFPIKSLKLFDTYENVITVTVNDVKVNQNQKDSFFKFTPDKGTEVFEFK